ncbi:plasmid replication protein, CyRepA1 family [Moorena sp. SIO3B2]|uniref:plasmid replication protein, CyRepA1 family n=1 Tax=Moorena sp. SIO3B2 TaxID=2607827 RepID=UPI0013CA8A7B|nr:plasmid replication protein, CyRepA1 family [Moorena sp. SIO3B2]NEP31753.1 DUF3854 domain-containing protein [Moorena sp. SIO3B2]NEP31778.1 DUF3854 domain-containing protein [Moorena sp. SIO3B2]
MKNLYNSKNFHPFVLSLSVNTRIENSPQEDDRFPEALYLPPRDPSSILPKSTQNGETSQEQGEIGKSPFPHIFDRHYKELKLSAIADHVIEASEMWSDDGQGARDSWVNQTLESKELERQNGGHVAKRELWRFNYIGDGAWFYPETRGISAKPDNPFYSKKKKEKGPLERSPFYWKKNRLNELGTEEQVNRNPVKYVRPPGQEAGIIKPSICEQSAIEIATKHGLLDKLPYGKDARRWLKANLPEKAEEFRGREVHGGTIFWDWLKKHPEVPILLTEGWKKTLSAISAGYPALGIAGITMHSEKKSDYPNQTPPLKEELLEYCQPGRGWNLALDQDEKKKTRQNVHKSLLVIGSKLKRRGCKVNIVEWLPSQGKGVDDFLYAHGQEAFEKLVEVANPFATWKVDPRRCLTKGEGKRFIEIKKRWLTFDNLPSHEEALESGFLGIKSPKNTGKSTVLNEYLPGFTEMGLPIFSLSNREQLARSLAKNLGIFYIDDTTAQMRRLLNALALCIDSCHPESKAQIIARDWVGCVVLLDEWTQILLHLLLGETCKKKRIQIITTFVEILRNASLVIALDADLDDVSVNYLKNTTKAEEPIIIHNTIKLPGYTSFIFESKDEWLTKLVAHIADGGTPYIFLSAKNYQSKWGSYDMEKFLKSLFPHRKFLRCDADSVAEPGHPAQGIASSINEYCEANPGAIIIATPTLETGVSIDVDHFTAVFAFGNGIIPENSLRQAAGRVRKPVPRYFYVTKDSKRRYGKKGVTLPDCYWAEHKKFYNDLQQAWIDQSYRLGFLNDEDQRLYQEDPSAPFVPELAMRTLSELATRFNEIAPDYREHVIEGLKREGQKVLPGYITDRDIELSGMNPKNLSASLTDCRNNMYEKHKAEIVKAEDFTDEEDFQQACDRLQKTKEDRDRVRKHKIQKRYGFVSEELIELDDKGIGPKIELLYFTTVGEKFLEARDKALVTPHVNEGAFLLPDVINPLITPKKKVAKIVLEFMTSEKWCRIDLSDGEKKYTNESPELIKFKQGITHPEVRKQLRRVGLGDYKPESTPYNLFKKFLWTAFGIKMKRTNERQSQRKEKRHYFYQISQTTGSLKIKDQVFEYRLKKDEERQKEREKELEENGPPRILELLVMGREIENPIVWPKDRAIV